MLAFLGVAAFVGMWSESYDRLWQAHLIEDVGLPSIGGLDPVVWFGILGVVGTLLSIAVAAPLGRRLEHGSQATVARALGWLYASLAASSFVFALAGSLWLAVLGSYGIFVARQVAGPLFTAWLNRSVDDSTVARRRSRSSTRRTRSASGRAARRSARRDGHLDPRRARACHRVPGPRPRVPARRDPPDSGRDRPRACRFRRSRVIVSRMFFEARGLGCGSTAPGLFSFQGRRMMARPRASATTSRSTMVKSKDRATSSVASRRAVLKRLRDEQIEHILFWFTDLEGTSSRSP